MLVIGMIGKVIIGVANHKQLLPMLMVHLPCKEMYASDTLSRIMHKNTASKEVYKFNDEANVCSIQIFLSVSGVKLQKVIKHKSLKLANSCNKKSDEVSA